MEKKIKYYFIIIVFDIEGMYRAKVIEDDIDVGIRKILEQQKEDPFLWYYERGPYMKKENAEKQKKDINRILKMARKEKVKEIVDRY